MRSVDKNCIIFVIAMSDRGIGWCYNISYSIPNISYVH